jgi:hypothetical protein
VFPVTFEMDLYIQCSEDLDASRNRHRGMKTYGEVGIQLHEFVVISVLF